MDELVEMMKRHLESGERLDVMFTGRYGEKWVLSMKPFDMKEEQ